MAYRARPGESQHQARERIARAKGFGSYREYRTSSAQVRERATRRLASLDEGYARTLRSSTASIRRRASSRVDTPAGSTLTSTDARRQYAHVRAAHRANGGDVDVYVYAVVRIGDVDRRRRDPRRRRGRDNGFRTIRFATTSTDLEADGEATVADFAAALDAAIQDQLARLYAGGAAAGGDYYVDTLAVTV